MDDLLQYLAQVEANASDLWLTAAYGAVERCARERMTFTTDDVWALLDDMRVATHDNRALGAVMRKMAKQGAIHNTGRTVLSARGVNHNRPVTLWGSGPKPVEQSNLNATLDAILFTAEDVCNYRTGAGFLPDVIDLATLREIIEAHRV